MLSCKDVGPAKFISLISFETNALCSDSKRGVFDMEVSAKAGGAARHIVL